MSHRNDEVVPPFLLLGVGVHGLASRVGVELRVRVEENQDVNRIRQSEQQMQARYRDDSLIGSVAVVMEFG